MRSVLLDVVWFATPIRSVVFQRVPSYLTKKLESLKNFDFSGIDAETLKMVISNAKDFIVRAECHIANLSHEPEESRDTFMTPKSTFSASTPSSHPFNKDDSIASHTEYLTGFLDRDTFEELEKSVQTLKYRRTGTHHPDVCLFGDSPYQYSKATQNLLPLPLSESPIVTKVLQMVNSRFGVTFNSVLVNRYYDKNAVLKWHKDDEDVVNNALPIISLSIGAVRRFALSDSRTPAGRTKIYTVPLEPNSVFVMQPGVQSEFYHTLQCGRGSYPNECGRRYSLTFRHLHPSASVPSSPISTLQPTPTTTPQRHHPTPEAPGHSPSPSPTKPNEHSMCYTALVFGSSLTKGLQENLLSKRGERVKSFPHPGAWIKEIQEDVRISSHICSNCVKSIFIVAGGNEVEYATTPQAFAKFLDNCNGLLDFIAIQYPNASINIMSLIPRRVRDRSHLQRMLRANEELEKMCKWRKKCRYIYIFSHFLVNKKVFFKNNEMELNRKLFKNDCLHFSPTGNSVIAKVIIGALYLPF